MEIVKTLSSSQRRKNAKCKMQNSKYAKLDNFLTSANTTSCASNSNAREPDEQIHPGSKNLSTKKNTVSDTSANKDTLSKEKESEDEKETTDLNRSDFAPHKSLPLLAKNSRNRFSQSSLDPNFLSFRKFCNTRKGENRLVSGPDYMVDALKLPNQSPRVSGESLQTRVAWRCPDGTQHLFCWQILAVSGQSLALNGPVVDSSGLNLVFGHMEATPNKLFLSNPT
ncbi:hypothetical protein TNCV_4741791 [Trichonephila clavipes]|nr:hypothetical protein TNCV_4741791 [Trichonephila clavipes]